MSSVQSYHCPSRNGCLRLRSDTVTRSLGSLPDSRKHRLGCEGEGREEKFERATKGRGCFIGGGVGVGVGMCVHFVGEQGVGTLLEVIVTGLKEDASCGI